MSSFTDLHALTGAYAVDALEDLERLRFERHLEDCPDCAAEAASLRETSVLLAESEQPALPAALRGRVLAEIGSVRPLPPTVLPQEAVRQAAHRFPRLLAAAAAVAILVGGMAIGALQPWKGSEPSQSMTAAKVMDASDAQQSTAKIKGGGTATVVRSTELNRIVVMTQDLPQAPANRAYELWLQDAKGVMKPAGTLSGGADATVVLSGGLEGHTGVGITVEPASGSDRPTTNPIALFSLKQA